MMKLRPRHTLPFALVATAIVAALTAWAGQRPSLLVPEPRAQEAADPPAAVEIVVAKAVYAGGRTSVCFADQFLTTYARETGQQVQRTLASVALDSDALFDYPLLVFSGEKAFTLSEAERQNLKTYLDRGGFVLASAGCSDRAWADSFRTLIDGLYGEDALTPLTTEHALFHTLYDIEQIQVRRPTPTPKVLGMAVAGRLRLVFSPVGLNDTSNAGNGCCCCGGNEIRNARQINANILAYALTH